jgi:hypothetical protein
MAAILVGEGTKMHVEIIQLVNLAPMTILMTRNSRTNISKREEQRRIAVLVLAECASQRDISRTQATKVSLDFQHNQCKQ